MPLASTMRMLWRMNTSANRKRANRKNAPSTPISTDCFAITRSAACSSGPTATCFARIAASVDPNTPNSIVNAENQTARDVIAPFSWTMAPSARSVEAL